ncbi:MAG TPA: sigma-70 family RNA polymerase sigma factor [Dokdonella sp.]
MSSGEERAGLEVSPDADIVARIAAGDRLAEAEFVRKYERGVHVLVRRHCRPNDPVAQDLAQEVLARVLERLRAGAIRDAASLPAYVRSTIVYTTNAEYRSRRTAEPASLLDELASDDNPVERVSSHELSHVLKSLLAQLPVARDREILVRFYLDEQDKDDVCRQLKIDASHFHRVVFRARERFRELLQRSGIESTP